jgi:hypothetical protein
MVTTIKPRLSKETIEKIKELREKGFSYKDLQKEFNLPISTIYYHINEKYRENKKSYERNKSKNTIKNLTPEQIKSRNEYSKIYFKNRYINDPIFRRKHIERVRERRLKNENKDL